MIDIDLRKRRRFGDSFIRYVLFLCGALSILTTVGIVYQLGKESFNFFGRQQWESTNKVLAGPVEPDDETLIVASSGSAVLVDQVIRVGEEVMRITALQGTTLSVERGLQDTQIVAHRPGQELFLALEISPIKFLTGVKWVPQIGEFGILPLLNATLLTTVIAMTIALPLGLSIAIYLSEYAGERARNVLKPTLEVLAGVPTVVYGYFALTFMTPLLRLVFGVNTVEIYNTASAGIVIGILVIPLVSSMAEDALSAVPRNLREASFGLGATRLETAIKIVLPAAFSGIMAAFILAISRAIGETMIVAIASGAGPAFTFNPFRGAETMTGHIVRISGGDLSYDSIDYNSLFAIGLVLFLFTLGLNVVSQRIVRRFREVYE